jgi:hypothetical protein
LKSGLGPEKPTQGLRQLAFSRTAAAAFKAEAHNRSLRKRAIGTLDSDAEKPAEREVGSACKVGIAELCIPEWFRTTSWKPAGIAV